MKKEAIRGRVRHRGSDKLILSKRFIAFLQEIGFHFSTSPFQDLFHLYFEIFKEEFHADILVIDLKKI